MTTTITTQDANKALVRRFIDEYQTGRDERVLYELVSPDLVNRTPMTPDPPGGPGEVKQVFDMFHGAFDGFTVVVLDQLADGDKVMTHKVFSGRHTGEFLGIAPTGREVSFAVMDILRIADGRLVEHWGVVDLAGLMQQLTG